MNDTEYIQNNVAQCIRYYMNGSFTTSSFDNIDNLHNIIKNISGWELIDKYNQSYDIICGKKHFTLSYEILENDDIKFNVHFSRV